MYNLWILAVRVLNNLLHIFGFRKQHLYWGVVYDSVTKQPIDPAIVKLVHVDSGRTVETCVTDMSGRYGFLALPGRYKLLVQRTNYSFPSVREPGIKDGVYEGLYHGEFFELTGDSDVVALNVPLDPVKEDWNQVAKRDVVKRSPYLEHLVYSLARVLFWFWFIMSAIQLVATRSPWYLYSLGVYALVFLLAMLTPEVRLWGWVRSRRLKSPIAEAFVELCHPELQEIVIAKARTSPEGKFFLRANPGNYLFRIRDSQGQVIHTAMQRVWSEGVVNRNYYL